ncbi:DNA/RNA non-specific endonuclease [Bacteroidota bacterium]
MKKYSHSIRMICILLISSIILSCQGDNPNGNGSDDKLEPISSGIVVNHSYYSLAYSEAHEGAVWVFYHLTPEFVNGTAVRKDNFKIDPDVSISSATLEDYVGSGYDRGHLCPAAAMKINQTAMDESFYMSNMSPQHLSCNRGRWKSLETKVRDWVITEGELYVVSGPIFHDNIESIGVSEVTVPGYYYKVIYNNDDKMIGFILPNEKCDNDLIEYVVSIDSIEELTEIDFFSVLSDDIEYSLESSIQTSEWDF